MLKSPYLFAIGVLLTLMSWATFSTQTKAAEGELGLSFDLSPVEAQSVDAPLVSPGPSKSSEKTYKEVEIAQLPGVSKGNYKRLPVPVAPIPISSNKLAYIPAPLPPISTEIAELTTTATVEGELTQSEGTALKDIGLSFTPGTIAARDYAQADLKSPSLEATTSEAISPEAVNKKVSGSGSAALSFAATDLNTALEALEIETTPEVSTADEAVKGVDKVSLENLGLGGWIFQNGSDSLVARTVGSAEGTRHWQGDRTTAYYGHVDPGNGVWNLGTFSYQHGASSPEEADEKQLQRLKRQGSQIEHQAAQLGVELSLEEKLNALDLANQAPLAALDRGGYIERLAQAHRLEMKGEDAILWARTYAYLDPDTRAWNAPGLGNNIHSISRDQERRIVAISKALKAFEPDVGSSGLESLPHIGLEDTTSAQSLGDEPISGLPDLYESFLLPPKAETPTVADSAGTKKASAQASRPEPTENPASELAATQVSTPLVDGSTAELPHSKRSEEMGIAFRSTEELTPTALAESAESASSESSESSKSTSSEAAENLAAQEGAATELQPKSQPTETDIFSLDTESVDAQEIDTEVANNPKSQTALTSEADISPIESNKTARQQRLNSLVKTVLPREEEAAKTRASDSPEEGSLWRVENTIPAQN